MPGTKPQTTPNSFPAEYWKDETCLLCFTRERPQWVNLTLQMDARGCRAPRFEWVSTEAGLLGSVHEKQYDCLILAYEHISHFADQVAPLLQSVQTSGCTDPVLLLASQIDPKELAACYEADLEFLQSPLFWDSPALVFALERCQKRHQLQQEHVAWARERKQKLQQEQKESERILHQQRNMLQDLKSLTAPPEVQNEVENLASNPSFPPASRPVRREAREGVSAAGGASVDLLRLKNLYADLLKSYIVMGTGSLTNEIERLAFQIELAGLSPREAMQLHLEQVEQIVSGLGNRSSRHVMNRADLLVLELMMRFAENRHTEKC